MTGRNIYVRNLSDRVTRRTLEDAFGKFGEVKNVILKYGYGFVVSCFLFD